MNVMVTWYDESIYGNGNYGFEEKKGSN